jgi:hypothetical protein
LYFDSCGNGLFKAPSSKYKVQNQKTEDQKPNCYGAIVIRTTLDSGIL